MPIVIRLAERFQIVVSPRILFVTVPRMKKLFLYFIRKLDARRALLRERTRSAESDDCNQEEQSRIHKSVSLLHLQTMHT